VQQGLELRTALRADERVQFVYDHVAQIAEDPADTVPVVDEHRFYRLRGDQQDAVGGAHDQRLAGHSDVTVPSVHRDVQPLAEPGHSVVLIVDQGFQRAYEQRLNAWPRLASRTPRDQRGADRQPGGFGLPARGSGSDDHVIVADEDRGGRPLLDVT
jgi:hypothetical protein